MIINGHILAHLEDPPDSNRAACNGEEIQSYPEFVEKKRGFQFCEACRLRAFSKDITNEQPTA